MGPLPPAVPAGAGRSEAPCSFETASALSTQSENMSTGSVKSSVHTRNQSNHVSRAGERDVRCARVWNDCPQILHKRWPMPSFLSILHETDFSWLQNMQENWVSGPPGHSVCFSNLGIMRTRTYRVGRVFLTLTEAVSETIFFACPWFKQMGRYGCRKWLGTRLGGRCFDHHRKRAARKCEVQP